MGLDPLYRHDDFKAHLKQVGLKSVSLGTATSRFLTCGHTAESLLALLLR